MQSVLDFFGMAQIQPQSVWIVIGLLLIIAETFLPGVLLVFFGISAIAVGFLLVAGVPLTIAWQLVFFGVFTVALVLMLRRHVKSWFVGDSKNGGGGDTMFPKTEEAVVFKRFVDGYGEVRFRGAVWQARSGAILDKGDRVTIESSDGIVLSVLPVAEKTLERS